MTALLEAIGFARTGRRADPASRELGKSYSRALLAGHGRRPSRLLASSTSRLPPTPLSPCGAMRGRGWSARRGVFCESLRVRRRTARLAPWALAFCSSAPFVELPETVEVANLEPCFRRQRLEEVDRAARPACFRPGRFSCSRTSMDGRSLGRSPYCAEHLRTTPGCCSRREGTSTPGFVAPALDTTSSLRPQPLGDRRQALIESGTDDAPRPTRAVAHRAGGNPLLAELAG